MRYRASEKLEIISIVEQAVLDGQIGDAVPSRRASGGAAPSPRRYWPVVPCHRRAASCRPPGTPSTSCNTGSRRYPRTGTAQRCSPRRAVRPERSGSFPRPSAACGSCAGCPSRSGPPLVLHPWIAVSSSFPVGYDEPEILRYAINSKCPKGADGEQAVSPRSVVEAGRPLADACGKPT